jgi:hypothetical protein
MKKVILLVAVLAATFACKKDKKDDAQAKFCYTCTLTQSVEGYPTEGMTSTLEKCDLTEAEKDALERATAVTGNVGGIITKTTLKCTKK